MRSEKTGSTDQDDKIITVHGSGSVAHQIIGEFLTTLQSKEGYGDIAKNLNVSIFDEKPTEASLRIAMFGEEPL